LIAHTIAVPSENLRRYLASKATTLDAIRTHVLNDEVSSWEINIDYWLTYCYIRESESELVVMANFTGGK
jgi:hypothetical protein